MFDLVLRNGTVIDGTGAARKNTDVAINGDRIAGIGKFDAASARATIDAAGLVVAPGFIDVHNHTDGWALKYVNFASKTLQGVTTEVLMSDGISYAPTSPRNAREWIHYLRPLNGLQPADYTGWQSLEEYFTLLDGRTAQNVVAQIPYANLRVEASGWGAKTIDDMQRRLMQHAVEIGMEAGAIGTSTGMDYICQCYASTDELASVLRAMAPWGGLYVTHMRYKLGLLPSMQEAVEICRRAGVPLHISHLKPDASAPADRVFEFIEQASRDVDITFDVYPYTPGSTLLSSLLPYEVWDDGPSGVTAKLYDPEVRRKFGLMLESATRNRLETIKIAWVGSKANAQYQGMALTEYVAAVGKSTADALCDLLLEENLFVLCVFHVGDDRLVEPMLKHSKYMLGSDGIFQPDGVVHPRQFGSTARILGPFVRERKLFSLEEAIRKMTGFPAARFGLKDRGVVREGAFADLTVFDEQKIGDPATFASPREPAVGVRHVLVNGTPIVRDGAAIESFPKPPGRWLKFKR
jgi:N-acyl-D-amino-acid deacylase